MIPPIRDWPIVKTDDGYYRYVNHPLRLLTTGFLFREALVRNADIIRVDAGTLSVMGRRYANTPLETLK